MKFGKDFRTHLDETLPEWRDKFLCYKPLKKLIKNLSVDGDEASDGHPWIGFEEWFVRMLDEELEKFNDFYVDKEEEFVIRLQVISLRNNNSRRLAEEAPSSRRKRDRSDRRDLHLAGTINDGIGEGWIDLIDGITAWLDQSTGMAEEKTSLD
ncbi:SPX domain-containing protein 4 [Platanthera guangdongensis]|uniref:SPX domain-containing protein 4 n=1 Tax=Platanthera guangdongensis TaxID=2320717 RepID=A0ABR2MUW9_9ASPA